MCVNNIDKYISEKPPSFLPCGKTLIICVTIAKVKDTQVLISRYIICNKIFA